ncbi:MarR family winged helix-turn-helix transcriptional regulator [Streptomyces jeddahensis]|uniref:MarR family protein n=1 Tax=Streptomyces jeddahensis TaxID=1716141 RepID=A0A177HUL3_9ACTN|nr:MarR family transcriptional regulator [Streptomyces jeddahensis]OAH14563.1 MarR family protein [Streptomyces jeddahensis]
MADSPDLADLPERDAAGESALLPPELRAWMGLLAAAGAIEQQLRSRVKETLGVSHDEFLVLCLLADGPATGLRMTQIAERLGRPKTRLTYQVACLQHAGLITRSTACGDRRGVQVTLTDKARRLLREASGALAEAVTQAVNGLEGPHDCALMRSLLPNSADAEDTA